MLKKREPLPLLTPNLDQFIKDAEYLSLKKIKQHSNENFETISKLKSTYGDIDKLSYQANVKSLGPLDNYNTVPDPNISYFSRDLLKNSEEMNSITNQKNHLSDIFINQKPIKLAQEEPNISSSKNQ